MGTYYRPQLEQKVVLGNGLFNNDNYQGVIHLVSVFPDFKLSILAVPGIWVCYCCHLLFLYCICSAELKPLQAQTLFTREGVYKLHSLLKS